MPTPKENGKMEDTAMPEQSPPTRRRVSFKPVAMPQAPPTKMTYSKRRWSLIRSLAKGKRLTSLTDEESSVMETLSSCSKEFGTVQRSESEDSTERELKARTQLRKSIKVHKDMLTDAETEFLQDLVDATDVAPEHIEHVAEVLCNDPLYQCGEEKVEETRKEEKKEGSQGRRSSLLQSPAYRRELWLQLRTESHEMSEETFAFTSKRNKQTTTDEGKVEEIKEEDHFVPEQKRKSSKFGFVYHFQKAFNLIDDRDKDDQTAELEYDDLDDDTTFCVLAHSIDDFLVNPTVLTPPIMDSLRAFLPFAVQHDNFWLKYSLARGDGGSFYTICDKIRNSARTVIAIETDEGEVFGSFTSSPWRVQPGGYYGSAEAFLWRLKKSRFTRCSSVDAQIQLESDIEVFEWSRHNRNIQSWTGMDGEMSVGGGGYEDDPEKPAKEFGAGLSLSADLTRGISEKCLTFNSPSLATRSTDGVFNIANIEVWTLTPVLSLVEAERLELGRHFIFDHGGFTQ